MDNEFYIFLIDWGMVKIVSVFVDKKQIYL